MNPKIPSAQSQVVDENQRLTVPWWRYLFDFDSFAVTAIERLDNLTAAVNGITTPFVQGADSITGSSATGIMELVGDAASPGNNKYYGTDGVGAKGWLASSSGGSDIKISTWSGRPGSPTNPTLLKVTDSCSSAIWDGSNWNHFFADTPVTPPVIGSFAWVNQGTSSTAAFGPYTTIIPQVGAAYALRVLEIAEPATPYTIEFGFLLPQQGYTSGADGNLFGAGWKEAGTGKLALIWVDNTSGNSSLYRLIKFNSPTSVNSVYASYTMYTAPSRTFFGKITNDGVNRTSYIQNGDGLWVQVHQVAFNDFLTPAKVCVVANMQTGVLQDRIPWIHWKQY